MLFTDDFVWALIKTFAHGFVAAQSHTTAAAVLVIGYDAHANKVKEIAQFFAFACMSWAEGALARSFYHPDDGIHRSAVDGQWIDCDGKPFSKRYQWH